MLIWMLSTFFFTLSGIRHGTGRGLTYFVLVYVLSYLFSLAANAIPADVQLLTGIRGGILVFGSLYPTYFSILCRWNHYLYPAKDFEVKYSSY